MIPELFLPGIISSGSNDMDITFDLINGELYFSRSGPDWFSSILYMKKIMDEWEGPFVASSKNMNEAIYPFISPNGNELYFDYGGDIYMVIRDKGVWINQKRIDSVINTESRESFASVSLNGNLYFTSDRESSIGGMDIYFSEFKNGNYLPPINLGDSINSKYHEFHACISPDEKYIIFDSPRSGGYGGNDLYISFRKGKNEWSEAINMGYLINTEMSDMRPYISPDGKYLFFCSMRSIPQVYNKDQKLTYEKFMQRIENPGNGSQDIYWVSIKIIEDLKPKRIKQRQ